MNATLFALGAIALWATLASLGVALAHVPPFLLTGLALVIGSVPAWPLARSWRVPHFPTAAVGLFGLVSGALALLCHLAFEPAVSLSARDWMLIVLTGLGPLGAAFFLWDAALKRGDARRIGILSYLTPLASPLLLVATTGRPLTIWVAVAAVLIVGAAIAGMRAR